MSGIVFFRTEDPGPVVSFYTESVGAEVWLEQPGCTILEHGGFKFGFCERDVTETCGILTFYYEDRAAVDGMYEELSDHARGPPEENEQYDIYQFFAEDPDGRTAEFQTFLHPI
ncbi:glyoxalase [Halobacteriales archaeon QS_8_69_26]|nr:MAG: glyoxalase [Halobacteriales archaeon QS_8_69_26]